MKFPRTSILTLLLAASSLLSSCSEGVSEEQAKIDNQTQKMLESEGIHIGWGKSGLLKPLGKSVMDMSFPDATSWPLFEEQVTWTDITSAAPSETTIPSNNLVVREWTVSDEVKSGSPDQMSIYRGLFDEVEYFKKAKMKVYLPVPTWIDYPTTRKHGMLFVGTAKMKNGKIGKVKGLAHVSLRRPLGGDADSFRIYDWKTVYLKTYEADHYLFEDVLDEAIPDSGSLAAARQSIHEEKVLDFLLAKKRGEDWEKPNKYFRPESFDRHPGVSIVDIDADGFDDFYVMERWGKNMLFRNQGDGTFEDVAPELGLDIEGDTSSAIFADFDNDGDQDLVLGGTLRRSMLLINTNGKFEDVTQSAIEGKLPYLISSVTAADYDNDGLIDFYLASYAGDFAQRALNIRRYNQKNTEWKDALEPFMSPKDWKHLDQLFEEIAPTNKYYTQRPGPPNTLLHNLGNGKFEVLPDHPLSKVFRNTYQATWADYDLDGDMDLYCANDFAPNNLFQNIGDGQFVDVTSATGTADIGFGMGATFGDYDQDGDQDMYVANMFSKAGRRVTSFFMEGRENCDPEALQGEGIDPVFRRMAEGNSLFRNDGDSFTKVSGMTKYERWDLGEPEGHKVPVEEGGWAWGVQFADFDNDSFLDLYGLSGYYSAPKKVKLSVDL
ncbi:MAG: VCBS repeat-containing protein [Planctomycetota bacterium]|jgi:hypothetical protein|nr:VCBS repeat-containing protein [Planctomycetota bacterium]MDP6941356.1 VCBS repeat-containing protein [Planctomycetota bacterium]